MLTYINEYELCKISWEIEKFMPFKLLPNATHPQCMLYAAARNENLQCDIQT